MPNLCNISSVYINDVDELIQVLYNWHRLWSGCDENPVLDNRINELFKDKSEEWIDGFNECMNFFDQELFEDLMEQIDPEYGE